MKSLRSMILGRRKLGLYMEFMSIWVWICFNSLVDTHCFKRYKSFPERFWVWFGLLGLRVTPDFSKSIWRGIRCEWALALSIILCLLNWLMEDI